MDSASDISTCKRLLGELAAAERIRDGEALAQLENTYYHLPPQTAPRLRRALDECISSSEEVLGTLFDKVEISDKALLNTLLRALLAYGNFRLTQINYHIESARDEIEPDVRYTPMIGKVKWHDLTPLLPPASNIGWKAIIVHGLVKDDLAKGLQTTCHQLMLQKLHFYASISQLDRFKGQIDQIQRNGERVAEHIAGRIFDAANDDHELVDLNALIFELLLPFTSAEQQAALIHAITVARLKFHQALEPEVIVDQERVNARLDRVISQCIMNNASLQDIFFLQLVEHLRYNLIRRKRRHSVDSDVTDSLVTLESVLTDILNGSDPCQTLHTLTDVQVSPKSLQKAYLRKWIYLTRLILSKKTLTPNSATILLTTCTTLLITCSSHLEQDLIEELSFLLAKTIDITNYRKLDKLFKVCGTHFLVEQTKLFAAATELLDNFDTPVMRYYRSFFSRQMRLCTVRHFLKDVEKFSEFVDILCDKAVGKTKSAILGYIYLSELSDLLGNATGKSAQKTVELYVEYGRSIGKKLYSFIKHRPFFTRSIDVDEPVENGLTNGGNGDHSDKFPISDNVQVIVIDALVCVLRIAVDRNEQTILDTYGELMLKLFNLVVIRVEEISTETKKGIKCAYKPIDDQLSRLCNLYTAHRATIEPYLCYDLNEEICKKLLIQRYVDPEREELNTVHSTRKAAYSEIKSKLESLQERDDLIYQTIINRQYASATDQSLGQMGNVSSEESCCRGSLNQLVTLSNVISTVASACDFKTYDKALRSLTKQFETCDALDHPRVLNLLHALASIIPNQDKTADKINAFKKSFPAIGPNLIRLAKSVELGPSVVSFTNAGCHKSSGGVQCCTYSNCIRIYTLIFNRFPPAYTNNLITDAMQMCISSNPVRFAKCSVRLHRFFIQLASSMASLLKAVSMGKRDLVEHSMPVFLSVLSLLIRCLVIASDQRRSEEPSGPRTNGHGTDNYHMEVDLDGPIVEGSIEMQYKVFESQLEYLSRDIGRLLNNLCFLETKLVDYAPHLISSYIKDTQIAACPVYVKKHIDEGIFRIFNLVDSYQKDRLEQVTEGGIQRKTVAGHASGSMFEMIHARLDQASREIFKDMHDNYNKFHRYLGKC